MDRGHGEPIDSSTAEAASVHAAHDRVAEHALTAISGYCQLSGCICIVRTYAPRPWPSRPLLLVLESF